jgi:hypothetical protein
VSAGHRPRRRVLAVFPPDEEAGRGEEAAGGRGFVPAAEVGGFVDPAEGGGLEEAAGGGGFVHAPEEGDRSQESSRRATAELRGEFNLQLSRESSRSEVRLLCLLLLLVIISGYYLCA